MCGGECERSGMGEDTALFASLPALELHVGISRLTTPSRGRPLREPLRSSSLDTYSMVLLRQQYVTAIVNHADTRASHQLYTASTPIERFSAVLGEHNRSLAQSEFEALHIPAASEPSLYIATDGRLLEECWMKRARMLANGEILHVFRWKRESSNMRGETADLHCHAEDVISTS